MASKIFLLAQNEYIHKQNIKVDYVNLSKSSINELQVSCCFLLVDSEKKVKMSELVYNKHICQGCTVPLLHLSAEFLQGVQK